MKKILLIFLLVVPSFVYASSYTDYQEYKMGVSEFLEENELLKREEYIVYNTYDIQRKYLDYSDSCSLYDENDYRDTEEITSVGYQNNPGAHVSLNLEGKFNYIDVTNYNTVDIAEIEITRNGEKVDFKIEPQNDKFFNLEYLNDGDINTIATVKQFGRFNIVFNSNEDIIGTTIKIVSEKTPYFSHFRVFYKDDNGNNTDAALYTIAKNIHFHTKEEYDYYSNISGISGNHYGTNNYFYKYQRLYHCYEEQVVVTNNYVTDGKNLIYDDYHTLYNYFIRSLIEEPINELEEDTVEETFEVENNIPILEYLQEELEESIIIENVSDNETKKVNQKSNSNETIIDNDEYNNDNINEIIEVEPLNNVIEESNHKYFYRIYIFIILLLFILLYLIKRLSKNN